MQRINYQSIGDVLRQTVQQSGMQARLDECKAVEMWPQVVGDWIASRAGRPTVKAGIMTIGVPDAPLRQELAMQRSRIRKAINDMIGSEVISEIRFIG